MQRKTQGFTLVEILVVIIIIGLIATGISRFNFSRTTQVELLNVETIKLLTLLEELRNNAQVGKAAWAWAGQIPENWSIVFNTTNDSYQGRSVLTNGTTQTLINSSLRQPFNILRLRCLSLTWGNLWNMNAPLTVEFSTSWITRLQWCNNNDARILEIQIWAWEVTKTIRINKVTNVIEEI